MAHNLLIPIAGRGSRFVDAGINIPKQLILAGGRHCLDWSMDSFHLDNVNIHFIVRDEHITNFSYDKVLQEKYGKNIYVHSLKKITRGSVESCLIAKNYINNDDYLTIFTMDVMFEPKLNLEEIESDKDGLILTFKSNSNAYSYAQLDSDKHVLRTAEKEVISNDAIVGVYHFKKGSTFVNYAEKMIEADIRTKNEFYLAPLYNLLIQDKMNIVTKEVDKMHIFGTPDELSFFEKHTLNSKYKKRIGLCADHSGYELKENVKSILNDLKIEFIDFGTYTKDACDYNDFVMPAAESIRDSKCDYIFGFCRSGQGISISSSSYKDIMTALLYDLESASLAIRHNCANFFSIPSSIWNNKNIEQLIRTLIKTDFDGGRHQARIMKLLRNRERLHKNEN